MEQPDSPELEQKTPSIWLYGLIVFIILIGIVWLWFMPSAQNVVTKPIEQPRISEPVFEPIPQDVSSNEETHIETIVEEAEVEQVEVEQPMVSQTINDAPTEDYTTDIVEITEPEVTVKKNDNWLTSQIFELVPNTVLQKLIKQDELVNNFVIFIDNASRGDLVTIYSPLQDPSTSFKAIEDENDQLSFTLDPTSYQRYDKYADLLVALPTEKAVEIYRDMFESIDNAHQQLGYTTGTFEAKLQRVIGYLLDTPIIEGEIKLVAPSAMYLFAEPELEQLMKVQKLLIRMGPENQQKIQNKLQEFKDIL